MFGALIIVLISYGLISKIKINKTIIQSTIILLFCTLQWIIATDFFNKIPNEPNNSILILKLGFIIPTITAGINSQGMLFVGLWISIVLLLTNVLIKKRTPKIIQWKQQESNIFLILYLTIMIIIPSIISPRTSFEEKLFLPLIPFFLIIIAKTFDTLLNISKEKIFTYFVLIVIILISFITIKNIGFKVIATSHPIKY